MYLFILKFQNKQISSGNPLVLILHQLYILRRFIISSLQRRLTNDFCGPRGRCCFDPRGPQKSFVNRRCSTKQNGLHMTLKLLLALFPRRWFANRFCWSRGHCWFGPGGSGMQTDAVVVTEMGFKEEFSDIPIQFYSPPQNRLSFFDREASLTRS